MLTTRSVSLALLVSFFPVAGSVGGTDVVQVTNGDRFTGTVSRLDRGKLLFSTDAAGTIPIAWSQVVRLTSSQELDVETTSGMRFSGPITSPADGRLLVRTDSGTTLPIAMEDVIRITPIASDFRARTSGSLGAGLNFRTAENTTNYTLDGTALYRGRSYEVEATLASWLSRRDDADREARSDLVVNLRRLLPSRWFALATIEGQQNDELELDWRFLAGGGVGRKLIQTQETLLSAHGGVDYDAERYLGLSTDHSAEAFVGVDWDWLPAGGSTEARVIGTTYASLARGRVRVELDAEVSRDLFWRLYWAVHALESYDSDPPGDRRRSDFGVSSTLGWSF